MSRIANNPITVPSGVDINVAGQQVTIKGKQGAMEHSVHEDVAVSLEDQQIKVAARSSTKRSRALAGTSRAVLNNMVTGVSEGFERRLQINGVGYRAAVQGKTLNLTLGFSHPVEFPIPEGITIETPSQTEVVIKGIDKQRVGQVAANIRAYRPPEPYKGKGVKYAEEHIVRKEAKKT